MVMLSRLTAHSHSSRQVWTADMNLNFDLKALQDALAQQQGNGMGLPDIQAPEPDVFPAQQPSIPVS